MRREGKENSLISYPRQSNLLAIKVNVLFVSYIFNSYGISGLYQFLFPGLQSLDKEHLTNITFQLTLLMLKELADALCANLPYYE